VFQVVNPSTGEVHTGNDHSAVYVKAIGIVQKSGVYVESVETGSVELVKGEKKLLLDPRKQRHIKRTLPADVWNRIIGEHAPHKEIADDTTTTTPWALAVTVGNNEAVLGPCTELLGYEESLETLKLSRGCPKTDTDPLETCFLRVRGNRISDQIELQSADLVTMTVKVAYGVTFTGTTPAEQQSWFNFHDYPGLLARSLRSRLRAAAQSKKFTELHANLADFIRDTVLGAKPAAEGGLRPGRLFTENNMLVDEVDVLEVEIPDEDVAKALEAAQADIVKLDIQSAADAANLAAKQRKDEIEKAEAELHKAALARGLAIKKTEAEIAIAKQDEDKRVTDHAIELDRETRLKKLVEDLTVLAKQRERPAGGRGRGRRGPGEGEGRRRGREGEDHGRERA
jgi:hypothetical protein